VVKCLLFLAVAVLLLWLRIAALVGNIAAPAIPAVSMLAKRTCPTVSKVCALQTSCNTCIALLVLPSLLLQQLLLLLLLHLPQLLQDSRGFGQSQRAAATPVLFQVHLLTPAQVPSHRKQDLQLDC
jgi:hypothetical protein